jgi:hypothetical protein
MKITKRDIIVFIAGALVTLLLTTVFRPDSTERKAKKTQRKIENIFK